MLSISIERLDRRRHQRVVEVVVRDAIVVDDVAIVGDGHARRRQVEGDDAQRPDPQADADVAVEAAVVDDVALPSVAVAAIAPEQAAVAVHHGDDAHAVRPHVERLDVAVGAALRLGAGTA